VNVKVGARVKELVVVDLAVSAADAGDGLAMRYHNTFLAIPAEVPFRPARTTPKPLASGIELAIVAAEKGRTEPEGGNELHRNERREVRVRFVTDAEQGERANASCWIRVASPLAGRGYGIDVLPRVGMEVAVACVEGDPDRPVVVGCLFNEESSQPKAIPEGGKGVALTTRIGDGRSERGHAIVLSDDEAAPGMTMKVDGKFVAAVAGDEQRAVNGRRTERVGGAFSITADDALVESVQGERVTHAGAVYVDSKGEIHLQATTKLSLRVGANHLVITPGGIAMNGKPFLMLNSGGETPGSMTTTKATTPEDANALLQ
jgi:type VI secretion system secreted protein VgrG